jgi:hypothetical protein
MWTRWNMRKQMQGRKTKSQASHFVKVSARNSETVGGGGGGGVGGGGEEEEEEEEELGFGRSRGQEL